MIFFRRHLAYSPAFYTDQTLAIVAFLKSGDHSIAVWAGANPLDLHMVNLHLYGVSRLKNKKKHTLTPTNSSMY